MTKLGAGLRSGYAVKCVAIYGRVFRVYFCVALYPVLKYEPRFQASAASVITFNPNFSSTLIQNLSTALVFSNSTSLPLYRSTALPIYFAGFLKFYNSTALQLFFFVLKCVTWEIILKTRLNHLDSHLLHRVPRSHCVAQLLTHRVPRTAWPLRLGIQLEWQGILQLSRKQIQTSTCSHQSEERNWNKLFASPP